MTSAEFIRIVCYMIGAPAFLILALDGFNHHRPLHGIKDLGFSMLFLWYMIEITLISTGVNTREYRIIGTPMIIAVTATGALLAGNILLGYYRVQRKAAKEKGDEQSRK